MTKPVLIDLFCGDGGAAMGYHRAGFDIIGVDNVPHPRFPFKFVLADALTYPLDAADAIHASPPCQKWARISAIRRDYEYPDLLTATRAKLEASGKPYVIENVPGAPMKATLLLCGTMFGLSWQGHPVHRHRLFEANWPLPSAPYSCCHYSKAMNVYTSGINRRGTEREFIDALGCHWAGTEHGLECIPWVYTGYIGKYMMPVVIHSS